MFAPLLVIAIVLFCYWFFIRTKKPSGFPVGPPRWPIVGSLPHLSNSQGNLLIGLRGLIQKYGPVVGYYIGSTPVVLISDYSALKTFTKSDASSFRPSMSPMHFYREGWHAMKNAGEENEGRPPGVVFSNGKYWKEQRKFLTRNIKDFGFGKSSLDSLIDEELIRLGNHFLEKSENGKRPVNMMQPLKTVIISILWTILFGEQKSLDDPALGELINIIDEGLRVISPTSIIGLILPDPIMTTWPVIRKFTGMDMAEKVRLGTNDFLRKYINSHLQTFDSNNIRGYVDVQQRQTLETTDPKSGFYGELGYYSIFNNVADVFIAGQDTTSSSILWTFLYLLHHPDAQKKIHDELDEVLGRGVHPTMQDRENLHYLNAVILESHRCIAHVPLGVIRESFEDIQIGPYKIPKGTSIQSGLYFIMNDPAHFKDPEVFNPDRFIDSRTGKFVHDETVVPFGMGKRNCLGQALGEQEFYKFVGGLLSMFSIRPVPGTKLPSYAIEETYPIGMVRSAPKFDVLLTPRVQSF